MTMTSSSFMSFEFDIQALIRRSGADMAMFFFAMLAYWVLQRVKTRSALGKTPCKESPDQECPSDHPDDILDIQTPPPQACKVDIKPIQINAVQHQPKAEQGRVAQTHPKRHVAEKEPFNVQAHLSSMRNYAASRNSIKETLQEFRSIEQSGESVTSAMWNSCLQAWINCGNIWAAENCLDQAKEAGLADATSFVILVKALVPIGDLEKARTLVEEMKEKVPSPTVATFDDLLLCFARAGLLSDGICLLKHMHEVGAQPAQSTLCAIAKLLNGARFIQEKCTDMWQVLSKYDFDTKAIDEISQRYPFELPRLLAVISTATAIQSKICFHDVEIKGSMAGIKALRETLAQPDFSKELCISDGLANGQHDAHQDNVKNAQVAAALRCVSKQGLRLPWNLEEAMLQYLGSNIHFLRLKFESNSIRATVLDGLSCLYPRLGFRHCWVKPSFGSCGQRTFSNGEEIDESSFNRHINAAYSKEMN